MESALTQLIAGLPGVVLPYAGNTAPAGWLLCDGSSIERASQPKLFAAIGVLYGSVDGTHFNLPDLRGRIPAGVDNMGGVAANRLQVTVSLTTTAGSTTATCSALDAAKLAENMTIQSPNCHGVISIVSGTTVTLENAATGSGTATARCGFFVDSQVLGNEGGTQTHQLRDTEIAKHSHTVLAAAPSSLNAGTSFVRNSATNSSNISTQADGGNDRPHLNVQPTIILNYIIKT